MPDKKPDLKNVQEIFRTLAIERGMPEVALKYVSSLGLSKKDYNKVVSQSVSKKERDTATEIVMGIGSKQNLSKTIGGEYDGNHPLDPAVDAAAYGAKKAKKGLKSLANKVRGKKENEWGKYPDGSDVSPDGPWGLGRYEDGRPVRPEDVDDWNFRSDRGMSDDDEVPEGFYEVLRRMGARLR